MSTSEKWLLPDGVDELQPPYARQMERLRQDILNHYHQCGYEQVYPAFVEYVDSLSVGAGKDVDLQTFKVIDQISGRMLGVRADITPQVARIAARIGKRNQPCRLCYSATALHATPSHLLASRTLLQTGAELYGHRGIESDLEILKLMIESIQLPLSNSRQITLGLGHVGISEGILQDLVLSKREHAELESIFKRKAVPDLEQFAESYLRRYKEQVEEQAQEQSATEVASGEQKIITALDALKDLIQFHGGDSLLDDALQRFQSAPQKVRDSIVYMQQVGEAIQAVHPDVTLYYDLSDFRGYHYHTGLVFAAYLEGLSGPVAKGGRYDEIGREFGFARAATGYSMDLLQIIKAMDPLDGLDSESALVFAPQDVPAAVVAEQRKQGRRVVCGLTQQADEKLNLECTHELVRQGDEWLVEQIEQ